LNTFGYKYRFTSFGESHGAAVGGVIDGCPAGLSIDFDFINHQLDRRACRVENPILTSSRAKSESDEIEWLSGVYGSQTLGTPIAFIIRNKDVRSSDYDNLTHVFRPGHADMTYQAKYGCRDPRGGGRASARETVARVVAGSIAQQLLREKNIFIKAQVQRIGECKDPMQWQEYVKAIAEEGDSIGGIVRCTISGVPVGLGEPVFDKLQAQLAYAIMSINACKGFDYGTGFERVGVKGSESNKISGGMLGGITTGEDIVFRAVFKPTPSIAKEQIAIDDSGNPVTIKINGRHDVCFLPRVLPVVECMAAMVIINNVL